jgi:hypothetical protein
MRDERKSLILHRVFFLCQLVMSIKTNIDSGSYVCKILHPSFRYAPSLLPSSKVVIES